MSKINLNKISTEQRNKDTTNIDRVTTKEMLSMINNEDMKVALAVSTQIDSISRLVDEVNDKMNVGGRLVYIGAGTSGRLGVLDASEMPPTFNVPEGVVIGVIAGGDKALRHPIENAEDNREQVIEDLKAIDLNSNDVLVGIAASGRTPYVISGIEYAKSIGCTTASLSTTLDSEIGLIADIKIEPVTGPEAITGSTRMKSGTAQKLVLNMISTGVMIKQGKIIENLMVDVKPTNEKLKERSIMIVSELTDASREEIVIALENNNYSARFAVEEISKQLNT